MPPHRPGTDTKIELLKDDCGRNLEILYDPLYDMSREKLLVLRKTLTDHLERNWIRASASPGSAPVLFAKNQAEGYDSGPIIEHVIRPQTRIDIRSR